MNKLLFTKTLYVLLAGCILAGFTNCHSDAQQQAISRLAFAPNDDQLKLPAGFHAVVVASHIGAARHIVVRDNGDIYVALRAPHNGHAIACLRDQNGDGKADIIEYFGPNTRGDGIGIYRGYLYFGSDTAIMRFRLIDGQLLPDAHAETIARFPIQHEHETKTFTFDNQGYMYVNVGAPSNACQYEDRQKGSPGQNPCPLLEHYAGIWRFRADVPDQTEDHGGMRYATGLRNCVALDWNPVNHQLYAAMNGRDQLYQLYPQYYNAQQGAELPAEEFLLIRQGGNYGWPYTYYDQFQKKRIIAPEYGGDGKKAAPANQYDPPIMAFPGHWAPLGLLFYTGNQFPSSYKHGAFIAFHGSWNRAPLPQAGFKVVFVPFKNGSRLPTGNYSVFADNFTQSPNNQSPVHRPVGLAQGPDGSLYITDDLGGSVWRIAYTGK
ncbi:glucose/arabinose dehydrogenase [Thermoflavifilum aggregans]|uniref:Glucose/arabinose dehydrogenase n=1 Tax=Thermoflavifilum aggregans TaxID=454188 RepID=A0A2M9CVL2_9BACT|nr:PQQ-dependent sugar dehydrogenase [Thermoflavifilum aggregans]PJJ75951.1 glucose/arabinose dehydrogenase [Thermoflavifilum aggregans]